MINISNVGITFAAGTPDENTALRGINLNVRRGDFITIVGSNGAGKSTLFNVISGNLLPTTGTITMNVADGNNSNSDDEGVTIDITRQKEFVRARYIGRIFQSPLLGTAGKMTLEDNMMLASYKGYKQLKVNLNKHKREQFRAQLAELDMGLEDRLSDNVELLSGGQRQALSLLMATMSHPKLLLLDEHTAALDPANAALVMDITNRIARAHKQTSSTPLTVMMITHNMRHAIETGNRLLMMDGGEIVFDIGAQEKAKLSPEDLVTRFKELKHREIVSDEMLLQ
ncbi:ABC transporter ATP-binding protein [Spirochaetia bacterium]|nr:ABC transporter ATP-binding protein [Spirochaetia bacterium]